MDAEASPEHTAALALSLQRSGRYAEAEGLYRQALGHRESAGDRHNLANVLRSQGRLEEAVDESRRAVRLDPRNPALLHTSGTSLLSLGVLEEGWPLYEARFEIPEL